MAYGTPTDPVAGTVITVAYAVANLLDPIRALRAFTGGADPPGSNFWLRSTSTSAVSWVARATEVLSAIGYTPVNKAGDSMSGALSFSTNLTGINLSAGSVIRDNFITSIVDEMQILANGNRLIIYRENASAIMADFNNGALTITGILTSGSVSSGSASFSGTVSIGGTTTAGAINSGPLTASTVVGTSGVSTGAGSVLARALHTGTQAPSTISPQGAGSGFDSDNLDGTTWHAGLTAIDNTGVSPGAVFVDTGGASVTLDRAGTWLILANSLFTMTATDGRGEMQIVVNGVAQTPVAKTAQTNPVKETWGTTFTTVSASVGHIAKIQVRFLSGGGGGICNVIPSRIVAVWLAP